MKKKLLAALALAIALCMICPSCKLIETIGGAARTSAPAETTEVPEGTPGDEPSDVPTEVPTDVPTKEPTEVPTEIPTEAPTDIPTTDPEFDLVAFYKSQLLKDDMSRRGDSIYVELPDDSEDGSGTVFVVIMSDMMAMDNGNKYWGFVFADGKAYLNVNGEEYYYCVPEDNDLIVDITGSFFGGDGMSFTEEELEGLYYLGSYEDYGKNYDVVAVTVNELEGLPDGFTAHEEGYYFVFEADSGMLSDIFVVNVVTDDYGNVAGVPVTWTGFYFASETGDSPEDILPPEGAEVVELEPDMWAFYMLAQLLDMMPAS